MNNASALRTLVTFGICLSLALVLGYLLSNPLNYSSLGTVGILALILAIPLLLRWHYPLLILSFNTSAILFLLPGHPPLWMPLLGISLVISVLHRAVDREAHFVSVPQMILPLLFIAAVVLFTAKMTGLGLRVAGSDVYGGKRYVYLLGAIAAYFAVTARRIQPEHAKWYLLLFFLSGVTYLIGDTFPILPRQLYWLLSIFPPSQYIVYSTEVNPDELRLQGLQAFCWFLTLLMLMSYGIRGMFLSGKPWRAILFMALLPLGMMGGFRSFLFLYLTIFAIQFYLEGLHRTKLLPMLALASVLGFLLMLPFTNKLPYSVQRVLSIVPLPMRLDPAAVINAEDTLQWRLDLWSAVLPEVPQYFLVGKGYAISPLDYNFVLGTDAAIQSKMAGNWAMTLADEFHNGPLSVIIPLGIWGVIGFVWFLIVALKVVYCNYRYGDPRLRTFNTAMFAAYITKTLFFLFVYGSLYYDMLIFVTWVGLSISINGGVCRRQAPAPFAEKTTDAKPAGLLPQPRPAFARSTR